MDYEARIADYIAKLKSEWRSSPAGIHWHRFYQRITRNIPKDEWPPNPLILGGSIASDAHKLERLEVHLKWAAQCDRLDEAIRLLDRIPKKDWNIGDEQTWFNSVSMFDEDEGID